MGRVKTCRGRGSGLQEPFLINIKDIKIKIQNHSYFSVHKENLELLYFYLF